MKRECYPRRNARVAKIYNKKKKNTLNSTNKQNDRPNKSKTSKKHSHQATGSWPRWKKSISKKRV